jgi:hypothetical protein
VGRGELTPVVSPTGLDGRHVVGQYDGGCPGAFCRLGRLL